MLKNKIRWRAHWFSFTNMKLKYFICRRLFQNNSMVPGYKIENHFISSDFSVITNDKCETTKVRVETYYSLRLCLPSLQILDFEFRKLFLYLSRISKNWKISTHRGNEESNVHENQVFKTST